MDVHISLPFVTDLSLFRESEKLILMLDTVPTYNMSSILMLSRTKFLISTDVTLVTLRS